MDDYDDCLRLTKVTELSSLKVSKFNCKFMNNEGTCSVSLPATFRYNFFKKLASPSAVVVYWSNTLFYRCTIELNHPGLGYRTIYELSSM